MPSIKFVSTEARCVERVGTLRAQRTSPMPDIFIIELEQRKWWRRELFFFLFNFLILLVLRTRGTLLVSSVLAARVWKVLLRGPQLGQISRFLFHSSLVSGPIVDSRLFKLTLNKTNFQVDKLAETHISLVFTLNCIAMARSCKRDSRSKTHALPEQLLHLDFPLPLP